MPLPQLLFSFQGRINRRLFWLWNSAYYLLIITISTIVNKLVPDAATLAIPSILVLLVFPDLAVSAKRWHDRNKSSYWLVLYIPLVLSRLMVAITNAGEAYHPSLYQSVISVSALACGAWIFVECGFLKGDEQANKYGEPT